MTEGQTSSILDLAPFGPEGIDDRFSPSRQIRYTAERERRQPKTCRSATVRNSKSHWRA